MHQLKTFRITLGLALCLQSSTTVLAALTKRDPFLAGYIYRGCYQDYPDPNRILNEVRLVDYGLTWEMCANACQPYRFFSVQYSEECLCGNQLGNQEPPVAENLCSMRCKGNSNQVCGEGYKANVFERDPEIPAPALSKVLRGCFSTDLSDNALYVDKSYTFTLGLTVEGCDALCSSYIHFSLRAGNECRCGNKKVESITSRNPSECNIPCGGDSSESCGSADVVNLYTRACSNPLIERVKNTGFEHGIAYWSATESTSQIQWSTPSIRPVQGRNSARIVSRSSTAQITLSQTVQVCPDETYTITFQAMQEIDSGCTTTLSMNGVEVILSTVTSVYTPFTTTFLTGVTSQATLSIAITCSGSRSVKIMYLDNVSVKPFVSPP